MKNLFYLVILILILSCSKESINDKSKEVYIGDWNISQKTFFEPSEHITVNYPLNIDTLTRIMGNDGVLKPVHQHHESFLNSNYLTFDSNLALQVSASDLSDGQYVFLYKSELIDLNKIKRITISVHGEQLTPDLPIKDKDLNLLVRLCSDTSISNNYFEIERPITLTKNNSNVLLEMWPNDNFINLEINKLLILKTERDSLTKINILHSNVTYAKIDNGEIYSIYKDPDVSKINRICIGLKNPGGYSSFNQNDGFPKSIKIWIN